MTSGSSPILGVWVDDSAKGKPVEQVAQVAAAIVALVSIVTAYQTKRQ